MSSPDDREFDADVGFLDVPSDQADGDSLALFESESESESGSGPGRAGDSPIGASEALPAADLDLVGARRPIALDQVLQRLGHVTWTEAVAIVEALCGVLTASGSLRVPEMSRVAITAGGTVAVDTGGAKHAGPALARMLHALAATGTIPASLRLLVTRWTSAAEEHSIDEFAKELAYFARPDGQRLIQAVYERAAATVPVPVPLKSRLEVPRPRLPRVRRPQGPRARLLYLAAASVVVLGIVLTALFAWSGLLSPTSQSSTASLATASSDAEGVAELVPTAGGGTDAPNPRGTTPGPRATAGSTPSSPAAQSARTASPSAAPGVGSATGTPAPVSSAVRASLAGSSVASSPRSVPTPAAGNPSGNAASSSPPRARRDGEGPPIYSSSDPDVTPPAFQHPQLPAQLLSGLRPDMNTIELIVSETGIVERVRLLSTPKRMADMMLLSGAKNWEFEPAVKDGQPVRYRLELSWAATP